MATELELSIGEHNVLWTLADHADLNATIDVTESAVSCVSVTGGNCYTAVPVTAPGVLITAGAPFSVTGYLAESVTICNYIDSSGWDGMVNDHLLALYYKFIGLKAMAENTRLKIAAGIRPSAFPDSITNDTLLGTYYYFINLKTLGNTKTGCGY